MKERIKRAFSRAQYAAIGAALGGFLGGILSRNAASTGAATGALVGAVIGEKRHELDNMVQDVKEGETGGRIPTIGDDEDSQSSESKGRISQLRGSTNTDE
ncbi:glycine zipper 2TM domain-containing protein [Halovenus rubra]|uniref:Glycine zipper 2TM domain-containing protein n=2 Tax=Halovenus rubra TaxID=869890 RepID=A0ACC7E2A7_9EURY